MGTGRQDTVDIVATQGTMGSLGLVGTVEAVEWRAVRARQAGQVTRAALGGRGFLVARDTVDILGQQGQVDLAAATAAQVLQGSVATADQANQDSVDLVGLPLAVGSRASVVAGEPLRPTPESLGPTSPLRAKLLLTSLDSHYL